MILSSKQLTLISVFKTKPQIVFKLNYRIKEDKSRTLFPIGNERRKPQALANEAKERPLAKISSTTNA